MLFALSAQMKRSGVLCSWEEVKRCRMYGTMKDWITLCKFCFGQQHYMTRKFNFIVSLKISLSCYSCCIVHGSKLWTDYRRIVRQFTARKRDFSIFQTGTLCPTQPPIQYIQALFSHSKAAEVSNRPFISIYCRG